MTVSIKEPAFIIADKAIDIKHMDLGGDGGFLGPLRKEVTMVLGHPSSILKEGADKKGYYKIYEHGIIYWSPTTGAHEIHGDILTKWSALGSERSFLGYPLTDQAKTPDGIGMFNRFQNGIIYWTPTTGAHEVHGDILIKWSALGSERSFLGYPLTDELGTPDRIGRFNQFQNGMIYWTPTTGAFEIHGAILSKWSSMGFERSLLGYPLTDELGTPDRIGRFNRFQNGMIYWTPTTGAFEVHGSILELWSNLGYETSQLGYPISDETNAPDEGRQSAFQNGIIYWSGVSGAYVVRDMQHFHSDINFDNGVALGGYFDLTLTKEGEISFSGHFHDSGADSYDTTLVIVLLTPGGLAYSVTHQGSTHGTFEPGSRDDDWAINQTNNVISEHWESQFSNAAIKASAYAGSMIGADLVKFVSDTAKELASELEKAIAGAIVALIF